MKKWSWFMAGVLAVTLVPAALPRIIAMGSATEDGQ